MEPRLLKSIQSIIREMTEENGIIKITGQELVEYLKPVSYNMEVLSKTKRFKGKEIHVTTSLDLAGTPISSLKPIKLILGRLDISNTNVSSLEGIEISGWVMYSNTPIARREAAEKKAKILRGIEQRREDRVFEMTEDADTIVVLANALFQHLIVEYDLEIDEDSDEEIRQTEAEIEELDKEYATASPERKEEITSELNELEERLDNLQNKPDVYFLVPLKYDFYKLKCFASEFDGHENEEWCIGDEYDIEETQKQYWENYVDEVAADGFNRNLIEDHLDMDRLRSDIEDVYESDVRDNPDAYLSESDKELSRSQQEEIERLETEKDELEIRLSDLDSEDDAYDDINDRIQEIDTEIDEINDSPEGEYKEEAIQEKISDTVDYYVDNYREYLSNMGHDISDYLDKDSLVQYLVNTEDIGAISSYDNSYDTQAFNDETYYIIRQS